MSHEKSDEKEMTSYFANKFRPARPLFVFGRSYAADPKCKPEHTLYDNWLDTSRSHPPHGGHGRSTDCIPMNVIWSKLNNYMVDGESSLRENKLCGGGRVAGTRRR